MPRTIQADGRTIVVPDDATDDEINQLVGPAPSTAATPSRPLGFFDHLQKAVDLAASPEPLESNQPAWAQRVASGMVRDTLQPLVHPKRTAESLAKTTFGSPMFDLDSALHAIPGRATYDEAQKIGWVPALERTLGGFGAQVGLGAGASELAVPAKAAAGAIRDAAIGDPNAAALRGLGVGPKSPKALGTIQSVEGARPFLGGGKPSLADLQGRISPAKSEIWQPYKQALDAVGDHVVNGPDGPTTVNDLEAERLQLSAINRGLKGKVPNPESLQLAQQKGLTQAQALAKEKAVQAALDPELASTGINPTAIRKAFGQVSDVGGKISGKSTLIEEPQPSGFGKIVRPVSLVDSITRSGIPASKLVGPISQIGGGLKDLLAGRPIWSAKPTDLGIQEGFASRPPKPDFGSVRTTGNPPPPNRLLPAPAREMPAPAYDGRVESSPPPIDATTTPMRKGRLLPAQTPARDLPLSSYSDIFPNQIPQARLFEFLKESEKGLKESRK